MSALPDFLFLQWQPYHVAHFLDMNLWVFVSMVFYAWVVQRNSRKIESLCRYLFSFRELTRGKNPERTKNVTRRFWNFSFLAWSFVAFSWILYVLWMYAGWHYSFNSHHEIHEVHWGCNYMLSVCAAFVAAFYLVKGLVIPVAAHMFEEPGFGVFLWRMSLSYDFLLSVFAFPLVVLYIYTGGLLQAIVFWALAFLVAIFFAVKILKAIIVGRYYSRFSYLHIFVYFCGLEILLPLCLWQIVFGL